MLKFKISEKANDEWDKSLLNSEYSTFYQSVRYLRKDESRFPIFIHIFNENDEIKAQLALVILKKQSSLSSKKLGSYMNMISNLGNRGTWVSGPIIFSDQKNERMQVLRKILEAIDEVVKKYNLIVVDGYSPPQDILIDEEYLNLFKKNGFKIEEFVTFVFDMKKSLDEIWKGVQKYMRIGVKRSEKRGIQVEELTTKNQLEEYFRLESTWSKTKGVKDDLDFSVINYEWERIKNNFYKIFLAYQNNELISAIKISQFNNIVLPIKVLSSYSHPTSLGGPILTWTAIKWTKENHMKLYDLTGGEAPPKLEKNVNDYEKKWGGIMKYKQKWGGDEFPYYHFVKVKNGYKYKLMRAFMKPDSILRNYKKTRAKK